MDTQEPWQAGYGQQSSNDAFLTQERKRTPLPGQSQFLINPAVFETGSTGYLSLALSSRVAISLGADSRLELVDFDQKPIGRTLELDRQYEPSQSRLSLYLRKGSLAVDRAKPNPLTVFEIETPHGLIEIDGQQFIVQLTEADCLVYNLSGQIQVKPINEFERILLTEKSVISLRQAKRVGYDAIEAFTQVPDTHLGRLSELARKTRMTTFFTVKSHGSIDITTMVPLRYLNQTPANKHRFNTWIIK